MTPGASTAPPRASSASPRSVLLVDDDPTQCKLGGLQLADAGYLVETASGADEALRKALCRRPDVVLSDVLMGDLDGFALCRLLLSEPSLEGVPVILMSAHYQSEPDQQLAARVGAFALVPRSAEFDAELAAVRESLRAPRHLPLAPVAPTMCEQHLRSNARQVARLLEEARGVERRYRTLFENAYGPISLLTPEGVVLEVNERWRDILGLPTDQIVGRHVRDLSAPGHEGPNSRAFGRSVAAGAGTDHAVPLRRADGSVAYLDFSNRVIDVGGKPVVLSIGHDVTAQVLANRKLATAEQQYRLLLERIPDVIWTCAADGTIPFITANVERLVGYTAEEVCESGLERQLERVHPEERDHLVRALRLCFEESRPFDLECRCLHKDGRWVWVRVRATGGYERDGVRYADGMLTDVSERRQLEESLRQAQKMEALGQLTGGVAHDFNNILASILANSHFLLDELAEPDPRRADADEIRVAAERAAALVRQLLAFSRRQVMKLARVDLNAVVSNLEPMLRRLIGEDVEFSVELSPGLGAVEADASQIEQVILNLVVNARDAMPGGGRLCVETADVDLGDEYASTHHGAPPGRYVMVAVTDTGCGMDAETRRHIFEPFFTTKELGRGTGLGLSTCYGIVKQSGGHIWVYSEPGCGTVFKIYLPRGGEHPEAAHRAAGGADPRGTETVLLIEDDERVRGAVRRMLEPRGYRLLVARDGAEALALATVHGRSIDLVLSDVVMPGANGPEVVDRVRELSGPMRALFMSGYTDHAIFRNGALESGTNFIQKPFAPEALARKVREVLDA